MKSRLDVYRDQRDTFLTDLVESLSKDDRFVAAWLTGSLSRNEADGLSDVDLSLVVSNAYSTSLCTRIDQVSAETSPGRHALFSQFGVPALVHENNNNAPEGGTFTFVLYSEAATMVDWVLLSQSKAKRPNQSKLLFDKVGIPVLPLPSPETLEQRRKSVSEQWAFFWMMTAITIKYINRNDGVFAAEWIENLHSILREIERNINGEPWSYVRGSLSQLRTTQQSQLESIRMLCRKMEGLKPKVTEFTRTEPVTPLAEIETLFSCVNDAPS